ncbi:MAG: DEAD/DEAH box helicase [Solirubrobacterales bacterium]
MVEIRTSPEGTGLEAMSPSLTVAEIEAVLRESGVGRTKRKGKRVGFSFRDAAPLAIDPSYDIELSASARAAIENRLRIAGNSAAVIEQFHELRAAPAEKARRLLIDSKIANDLLDDHQLKNVAVMAIPNGWGACVFDEQGTGKTLTVVAAFDLLAARNLTDVLVVIAPKSMVAEWAVEFQKFTGEVYTVAVAEGSRREKARALSSGADVVVINYEGAVAIADDLQLLAKKTRVTLVVDESFNVKNPDARRTAVLSEIREFCDRCFVLCGTPAPNSPLDLVAQFNLADLGLTFDGVQLPEDEDRLRTAIRTAMDERGIYTRNLKQVVLPDLPVKEFTRVAVEMPPVQEAMYNAARGELVDDLTAATEDEFQANYMSFLERRNALLRICSNPSAIDPSYDEVPGKLAVLDELIPRYIDGGEKIVLWSYYRASLDALADRYRHFGLVRIDGSVPDVGERREAVRRFQEDDDTRLFLGNPAAAGAGLTLHSARIAIYESMSNQAAHFMQSLDRIHRRGQARDVEYVMLLCDGSIEEVEYQRLLDKTDAQADVLGDPVPIRPTRDLLLRELLGNTRS